MRQHAELGSLHHSCDPEQQSPQLMLAGCDFLESGVALEETPLETSVDLLWCWIQKNAQIQSEISSPR